MSASAMRVAGQLLRELHHLLLVDNDAVGVVENLLHLRDEVADALLAVMPLNELVDHAAVDWARPVKRVKRRQVLDALRLKLAADLLHPDGFKLKNRIRPPLAKQLHSLRIVKRNLCPVDLLS